MDGVLVRENGLIEHVLRTVRDAQEEKDLGNLHLEILVDLFNVEILFIRVLSLLGLISFLLDLVKTVEVVGLFCFFELRLDSRASPIVALRRRFLVKELVSLSIGLVQIGTLLSDLIHAILQGLLVETEGLLGQLEPDPDHVAHVHEALVQVAELVLRGDQLDQAAELVRKRASMTARLVALVKGLLLHNHHEFDQQSSQALHLLLDLLDRARYTGLLTELN